MAAIFSEWLGLFTVLTVALIGLVVLQPSLVRGRGGKVLAFVALFVLPLMVTVLGAYGHLESSKSTEFCVSCHVMEPYGESLFIDSVDHLAAVHFQNNLVPQEKACFTCHTQYTMYGDITAKLNGVKHLWVYYSGTTPEQIELYEPYHNRECMSCHGEARSFLEGDTHVDFLEELESNETSCLECHDMTHDVANLEGLGRWHGDADGGEDE